MSQSNLAKDILEEILNVFSSFTEKMNITFAFCTKKITHLYLKSKFRNIKLQKEKKLSFETNEFYIYLMKKTYEYLQPINAITFNSPYSFLYFSRIIRYLTKLLKSNIEIVEDDLVKIFLYLFFIFLEDQLENFSEAKNSNRKINLDETFYKGTFIELKEKYSSKIPYEDSEEITNLIEHFKTMMKVKIISNLEDTFQFIKDILQHNSSKGDKLMEKMYNDASEILYEISLLFQKDEIDLADDLVKKIKIFYSNEDYLIFTNYISETDENEIYTDINKNFLQGNKKSYFPVEFDYSLEDNSVAIDNYIVHRKRKFKRMKYSWCPEVLKFDLNNELNIFAFSQFKIFTEFDKIQNFQLKLKNLEQKKIIEFIKEILNDNDFYEHYFSILKCDIVKNFFTSNLLIISKDKIFQKVKDKTNDSGNFKECYSIFMNEFDKKNDNYKEFKSLIIYKILPYGDRAYTLKKLRKLIINPVQFFLGNNLKEELDLKIMIKGYLTIILLLETEHFLPLLDKNNNVFPLTPREKEGSRLFIKYLLDVYSINHINLTQANNILDIDSWKDHEKLKKIFRGQLEDIEEEKGENFDEFLYNYFDDSLSFFTNRQKNKGNKNKFNLDEFIKK